MPQAYRIIVALAFGLFGGALIMFVSPSYAHWLSSLLNPVGKLWLNGLQMTIVPLVFALLVTGIAASAEAARASRIAARAMLAFFILLSISAAVAALVAGCLLTLFPLPAEAALALSGEARAAAVPALPSISDMITSVVPTNPIHAAASSAFLPLIVFALVFAFATSRLPGPGRQLLTGFFQALAETMLIVIGWVLNIAPIGVFALAFGVASHAGGAIVGALVHYLLVVSSTGVIVALLALPVARLAGGVRLSDYAKAMLPPAAVACSTQSSLASLPTMLIAAERLGAPTAPTRMILPLAVTMFRFTGPAMNLAVAMYVAHACGISLTPWQICIGIAVAAVTALGSVSLPGTISFISSIAPIALAMGVPVAPLALLVAVETLPDIVRTVGNVLMDVAVTKAVTRRLPDEVATSPISECGRNAVEHGDDKGSGYGTLGAVIEQAV